MDPVQRLYITIQQENFKIQQINQSLQNTTGDIKEAYSTIQAVHVSTVAGLTTTIYQYISTALSQ
jgi:hypothetical protein